MKLALLGMVALGVIVGGTLLIPQTEIAIKERIVEVEKIVEVPTLDQRISEAQAGAEDEVVRRAEEAYNALYEAEMQKIADRVKSEYIAEIEATIEDPDY